MKKILTILTLLSLISCNIQNGFNAQGTVSSDKRVDNSMNSVQIKVKIIEPDTLKLKLICIPPDSGFWIYDKDTIHLDSINYYLEKKQ